jgi:hypothetical protein
MRSVQYLDYEEITTKQPYQQVVTLCASKAFANSIYTNHREGA